MSVKPLRYVIKDIDSRKILKDSYVYNYGQTIELPKDYDIVFSETNNLGEVWYYVKSNIPTEGKNYE